MILVTSAAYINDELQSEFGKIPPSFLPLQNKRLYEHQIRLLSKLGEKIIFSIPNNFIMDEYDNYLLKNENADIIYISSEISLRESLLVALEQDDTVNESLLILHGDTLFTSLPEKVNSIFVSNSQDNYNWGKVSNNENELVYSGLFWFENKFDFFDILKKSSSFLESVENYSLKKKTSLQFVDNWFDLGHINTFFRSKSKFTTQRTFNDLQISKHSVKKVSSNKNKMDAEFYWYQRLPNDLKYFTPALIGKYENKSKNGYEIEYLYLNSLNELFVFGDNNLSTWKRIFDSCIEFLKLTLQYKILNDASDFKIDLSEKTKERLINFSISENIDLDKKWIYNGCLFPSINQISEECLSFISDTSFKTIIHGDFCFSNILYDFRKNSIKVIDPRCLDFKDSHSIYGDLRYDIAKLIHSAVGMYDFIIADRYTLEYSLGDNNIDFSVKINDKINELQNLLINKLTKEFDFKLNEILAITVHLFLSMLPLHYDNKKRQMALLANAFRIYKIIKQ
jgi:hypothetical protein